MRRRYSALLSASSSGDSISVTSRRARSTRNWGRVCEGSRSCLSHLKCFFSRGGGGGGGLQIGVHDGYIHRFTSLKILWITRLELGSVERNYLLGDKLTLSRVPTDRKSLTITLHMCASIGPNLDNSHRELMWISS